jgi:hypothetical protein
LRVATVGDAEPVVSLVSERLGHATVAMTLDIISSHAIPTMQEEATQLIAGLVFCEQAMAITPRDWAARNLGRG